MSQDLLEHSSQLESIIFNWQEVSTSYVHELITNTINEVVCKPNEVLMGGYAFIEDFHLGSKVCHCLFLSISYVCRTTSLLLHVTPCRLLS
jgi:hypothetical protein